MLVKQSSVIFVPPSQIVLLPLYLSIGNSARLLRLEIEPVTQKRGSLDGRKIAHQLAATLSVNTGVETVPYHGGNFISRHYHTIASRCGEVVDVLRPLVSAPRLTAYERAWELWRGVLSTLNRAALTPPAEQARFKADAQAFVRLLQGSFPCLSITPKLQMLFALFREFMGLWSRTGMSGEQAIKSWHGFYNKNAPRFTSETALLSCRKLVQTMALSGVASEALRQAKAPIRKRKAAPRGALRPGDKRLRQNKTWRSRCLSKLQNRIDDRAKWAKNQFEEGNGVIEAYAEKKFALDGLAHSWTTGCDLGAGATTSWAYWLPMSCQPEEDQEPGSSLRIE